MSSKNCNYIPHIQKCKELKEVACTACQALDVAPYVPHLLFPTIGEIGTIIIPTVQMKQRGREAE